MKKYFIIVFFLVPFYLISQAIKSKVVRIAGENPIIIIDSTKTQMRVRLYEIDTTEKGQDFTNVAKQASADL